MDYLILPTQNQTITPKITTQMIVSNRLKFMTRPIAKLITLPWIIISRFADQLAEEGRQDILQSIQSQELSSEKARLREIQIQQLRDRASEPTVDMQTIVGRKNGKKGGRPRKHAKQA